MAVAGRWSASSRTLVSCPTSSPLSRRASAGAPDTVTVLVDADAESIDGFRDGQQAGRSAWSGSATRGRNGQQAGTLAMFSVATVFLLLASLVAAAGFAVIAQRRLRQLGMLAATGATPKHLRLVLLTNGAVVGAIGAVIGTVVGLALWFAVLPTLETAFDHRIDPLSLPWTLLALVILVAMLGATGAAWWPGRAVARVPVTLALSARPARPKPAHRSAILAALLVAGGVGSLRSPTEPASPSSSPGFWRRSSARCSSALWQSASSPGPPVTSRSPHVWRYGISRATRPAPGPLSPRSPSRSASQRQSSSPRQHKRSATTSGWPPSPLTSPTAKSGSTSVERETLSSSRCRSSRLPSSHGVLRASASSPQVSVRPS